MEYQNKIYVNIMKTIIEIKTVLMQLSSNSV